MHAQPLRAAQPKLDLKVALVLPGLINDGGFNQVGYESLRRARSPAQYRNRTGYAYRVN